MGRSEGINWQELWALKTALEPWGDRLSGNLVLARMDNSTAAAYANYGAGRVPLLTKLARSIEELEAPSVVRRLPLILPADAMPSRAPCPASPSGPAAWIRLRAGNCGPGIGKK